MSVLLYYLKKIWYALALIVLSYRFHLKRSPGIYYGKFPGFTFQRRIVFAFWNPVLIHLGDQLFHQPLVEAFLEKKYQVIVCATPPLVPYFEALGARCIPFTDLRQKGLRDAVFISKHDMAFDVWRYFGKGNAFVGLNYGAMEGQERITTAIFRAVTDALGELGAADVFSSNEYFGPQIPASFIKSFSNTGWMDRFREDKERKFLVFNNYVSSGYIDVRGRTRFLDEMARRKKREGYVLVHVGSRKEMAHDRRRYDFIDIDMRGQLKPSELFVLFSLPNVYGAISFDTFVAHVASLCRKDLYVVARSVRRKEKIRERFIPMFIGGEDLVKEYL